MDISKLKENFKTQLNESIDKYEETDPKCAYAAGMLVILSALIIKDGPTISTQIKIMHKALREVGDDRGWAVRNNE